MLINLLFLGICGENIFVGDDFFLIEYANITISCYCHHYYSYDNHENSNCSEYNYEGDKPYHYN